MNVTTTKTSKIVAIVINSISLMTLPERIEMLVGNVICYYIAVTFRDNGS
jgi:hypothetical protein